MKGNGNKRGGSGHGPVPNLNKPDLINNVTCKRWKRENITFNCGNKEFQDKNQREPYKDDEK